MLVDVSFNGVVEGERIIFECGRRVGCFEVVEESLRFDCVLYGSLIDGNGALEIEGLPV